MNYLRLTYLNIHSFLFTFLNKVLKIGKNNADKVFKICRVFAEQHFLSRIEPFFLN